MKNSEEDFKSIGIIGLGLIGGSVAKALKHSAYQGKVYGLSHNPLTVQNAYSDGVIDNAHNDFARIVKQCDLIILATPIGTYAEVLNKIRGDLPEGCLITDVGSVKMTVHTTVNKVLNGSHRFIGGHPMAGSEKSGYNVSKAHLFENAYYFLTLEKAGANEMNSLHSDADLQRLWRLVEHLGGKPHLISPQAHDHMVARTSHLPHISASLLVKSLGEDKNDLIHFVGGGFRDATRIAAGDPKLWRDILLANQSQIVSAMDALMANLEKCKAMILSEDTHGLEAFLTESKLTREGIPKHLVDNYGKEYALYIDVKDQPGVIAQVASLMAVNDINIKDIEIIHAREHIPGVLKVGYYNDAAFENAKVLLSNTLFTWSEACSL